MSVLVLLGIIVFITGCSASFAVPNLLKNSVDYHGSSYSSESEYAPPPIPWWGKPLYIPMRDGVKLYGQHIQPLFTSAPSPTILIRTPYPISDTCPPYSLAGWNCIEQWFRGRYLSQGNYSLWGTEAQDAYDSIDFIKAQPWSNGVVVTYGGSALGIAQYMDLANPHPNMRAQTVIVGTADIYTTAFQGGGYRHSLFDGWLNGVDESYFSQIVYNNENNPSFWANRRTLQYCNRVTIPAVHLAGWWDIFLQPQLTAYDCYQNNGGPGGAGNSFLVVVPTGHCEHGWNYWPSADVNAGIEAAAAIMNAIYLASAKGNHVTTDPTVPHMAWYVMMGDMSGTSGPGNYWTAATKFPAYQSDVWYFTHEGGLSQNTPSSNFSVRSFVYDPRNPVGTIGGNNLMIPCGPYPQNSIESRSDVLVFTSPPLNADYYITGPLTVTMTVTSNCTDTDFSVRLTEVFQNGTSVLVQDGITRLRWRDGINGGPPQWIVPGTPYTINVSLWSTSYVFARGHSFRVTVTSSNNPRFLPNLNNGKLISQGGDPVAAQNVVFINNGKNGYSYLTLPKVTRDQIPPVPITTFRDAAVKSIKEQEW